MLLELLDKSKNDKSLVRLEFLNDKFSGNYYVFGLCQNWVKLSFDQTGNNWKLYPLKDVTRAYVP